jgi:hypothetical protein
MESSSRSRQIWLLERVIERAKATKRPSGETDGEVSPAQEPGTGWVSRRISPVSTETAAMVFGCCRPALCAVRTHRPSGVQTVKNKRPSASFLSGPPSAGMTRSCVGRPE